MKRFMNIALLLGVTSIVAVSATKASEKQEQKQMPRLIKFCAGIDPLDNATHETRYQCDLLAFAIKTAMEQSWCGDRTILLSDDISLRVVCAEANSVREQCLNQADSVASKHARMSMEERYHAVKEIETFICAQK